MIVIRCPYCAEERFEDELHCGGEVEQERPAKPSEVSDVAWTDYLYMRANVFGTRRELWCCAAGCGSWFKVARHTVTHEILEVVRFDESLSDQEWTE